MNSYVISQLIALALTVALFVILIVVLTRNKLSNFTDEEKTTALDNKVNWLYGLAIASVGITMVFAVIALLMYMRWTSPCA